MEKPIPALKYNAAMDWWIAGLLLILIAILLVAIPVLLISHVPVFEFGIATVGILIMVVYIIQMAIFTGYYLTEHNLVICQGMMRVSIPYRSINSLKYGNLIDLISLPGHKRLGFSPSCLVIRLTNGPYKSVTISPIHQADFVNRLLNHIDLERSKRSTIIRGVGRSLDFAS